MSFRNVVSFMASSLLAFSLAACSNSEPAPKEETKPEEKTVTKVLVPSGAAALGMLGVFDNDAYDVEVVDGTDVLTAELAKKDSDYDVIVAPVNLGVKVYSQTETYKLNGILTWGNLYLVGEEDNQWESPEASIAAFGENAVPGLVYSTLFKEQADKTVYYPSVAEAQQSLLAGKENVALLAQPAAAAAIAKGKEQGKEYEIIADLQTMWQNEQNTQEKGYPQAAVFTKEGFEDETFIKDVTSFIDDNNDEAKEEKIDKVGPEKLGVPNAQMAVNTWKAQNIHYKKASQCQKDIETFLSVFDIKLPEGIIAE